MSERKVSLSSEVAKLFTDVKKIWVGISGGVDSIVLCHLLKNSQFTDKLHLIYVDDGIHPKSREWGAFVANFACQLGIPFTIKAELVQKQKGESLEAKAREQRYKIFQELMEPNSAIVVGHHLDDFVETFFLRILRGGGLRAMGGMQTITAFSPGFLVRPFLSISKKHIQQYAALHALPYVHDDSNDDIAFDRNYLRKLFLPILKGRWPSFENVLYRNAKLWEEEGAYLQDRACLLLEKCLSEGTLDLRLLKEHHPFEQKLVVKAFITQQASFAPSYKMIDIFLNELADARLDAMPSLHFKNGDFKRYRHKIFYVDGATATVPHSKTTRKSRKHFYQTEGIPPWEREKLR